MRARYKGVATAMVTVSVLAGVAAAAATAASGWQPTGSMAVAHRTHGAVLLDDGRVLVNSGYGASGLVPVAELYDPDTGTWTQAAPPLVPRRNATTTKLSDGRVLAAGGTTAGSDASTHAELYDPVANTWTATGAMLEPRQDHRAVLLDDGRVLVTGGTAVDGEAPSDTAEIWDPATGTWTAAGTIGDGRANHQSTLLADGRVLVAGGGYDFTGLDYYRSSSVIYDPDDDSWAPTASMSVSRGETAGALLHDGTVLVAGGRNTTGFLTGSERFDPVTGAWTSAGTSGVTGGTAEGVVLHDGRFLLSVWDSRSTPLFDPTAPADDAWSTAHETSVQRGQPSMTLLSDGRVLLAGGDSFSSAELFTPPTERGSSGGDFATIAPGETREQDVTLTNAGGNPLWIDGTGLAGDHASDFAVVDDACTGETLQPTESCVVRLRFAPSATGARTAELTIDDNAESSPPVVLTGAGGVTPVDPPVDPPVGPPGIVPTPHVPLPPLPDPTRAPAQCSRRFVTLAGITPTSASGNRVRLTGVAAASLVGKSVRIERNGRRVGETKVADDGRIDATVTASTSERARRIDRYRLVVAGEARSRALKATRRVSADSRVRQDDGQVTVSGRIRDARRVVSLTLRSDAVCGPKTRKVVTRTDSRGRFRVTLPAPVAGSPATIHRLWWGTRSVSLPVVVTAGA